MFADCNQSALDYHRYPKPGKLEVKATKPLANQRDLVLAYSPSVAAACREDERVLQVAHQAVREGIARPLLIGRPEVIEAQIKALGLRLHPERDFDLVVPGDNPRIETHWRTFYDRVKRRGYAPDEARESIRNDPTVLAATMVLRRCRRPALRSGRTLCAPSQACRGDNRHRSVRRLTAMNAVMLLSGPLFLADTYVQLDPSAEDLAETTRLCAAEVRCFGITPRVALVSHSDFGSSDSPSAIKMTEALRLLREQEPELEVEGEMHANLACDVVRRQARLPDSRLTGRANPLILPNQDAVNIAFNLLRTLDNAAAFGPTLLGTARLAHIVTPSTTVRGLLNMTALAVVQAS
ncbi:MAG: phosphate acyltransferase [Thermochromatium sp.]